MLHTQNVFFQFKSSLHSQEFHGQEERNQVACSGHEKLEIGVDRKHNMPARHLLHVSDEDKPAFCEKNTEQEFVMMTNSSQEDPLLQLAIALATQQLRSPKAVHQDAEHMTAEEPDLHHRQGGENATTTAGSQQGTDTLHCEQADVSNPDVFRQAKNLMEQAEPFVQPDRKWMNGDNRALTQHLSLQERPQSPRISQHGMPSKDSNMHQFGYPRPVPLASGSVVLYKAATVSAVLSENEPSPSPNVMLLQSCRQEASSMEAVHCDAFAPEDKVSQDFEESEVLRWEVNRSNNQAQDQPALFTPGTVSILVGEPAPEHAASLQGHKVGAVTAEVIRLPEEMQHLGSTARNVSHLSTEDVPQPLNSLLDNGLQLPLPSHLKGLQPGLRRLEKGLGAVGAGTILERVYKTALKEVDDMLNVKAWLMELLHLIPDEVMAHPPPTHLPVDQDDTIHFHIPVYLSVPNQSTHDLYHTAQTGPQRSVLSEDECMVLIRTLLCAGKALVAAASSSGPSHSSAALSGSAASSSGLFMVSQSKSRQGAATELPGPTAAAVAAATEAGTPYERLLLYSRSSALRPVPLYSLDLSGHEVTDRVMCDLVACAEDLGQECKLQALRMSRVLLTMGQRFSQESPLWSLAIKAPSLSHQLRLLDLSYNLHIVWDDVLWFTLLTSLSSLQHLDVRSTGFDDYGLKKLLWAFGCPAVSCKDSLQCLRLGPPSSATSSGPLPYSYDWSNFYLAPCLKQGLPRLQGLEVVGGLTEDQQQTIMEAVPQGRSFNGSMFTMRGADRDIFGEQYDQDGVFGRWKERSIKQTNYRGPSSAYFSDDSSYGVPGTAPWDLLPSESGASLRHHTLQMHEGAINKKQQQQQKSHAKAAAASFYQQFGGGRQASVGDKCRSIDLTRVQPGNEGACIHGEREQASAEALHDHRRHRPVQAANPRQRQRQGQYHNKTGAIHQGRRRAVPRTSGSTMRSRGHVSKADVRRNGSNVGIRGSSGTSGLIKGRPAWRSGEMEGCDQGLGGDLLNSSPDAAELKHGKRKRVRASASGGAGHCRVEELLEGQAGCEDLEGLSQDAERDGFEEEDDDYASDDGFVVPDGEISDSSSLKAERLLAARRVQEFDDEPEDVDYESPFIMRPHDKLERRLIADELPVEDSFNKDNEIVEEGTDGEGAGLHQKASEHRFSAERPAHSKPSNDGFQAKRQKHVMGADSAGFRVSDGSRNKEKRSSRAERIVSHVSREVLDLQPFSFDPDRKIAKPGNIFEEVDVGKRRKLPVDTRKKQALERIAAMNQKSQTLPDLQNAVFGGPAERELRAGEKALLALGLPSKGPDTSHQRNSHPRSASDLDPSDLSSCSDDSDEVAGSHGSIPRAAFRTAAVERDASLVRDFRQDLSAPSMVEERRKRTAPCSWQKMEDTSGAQADAGGSARWSSRSPDARLIMEHDGRQLSGLAAAEGRTDEVVHLYTKPRGSSLTSTIRRKQQVVLDDSSDEGERVNPRTQGPQHTSSGQQDSMLGGHAVVNHKGRRREDQDLLDHGGTGSGISIGLGPAQYAEEHEVEAVDLEALQLEIKTTEEELKLLKTTFDSRVQSVPEEDSSVTRLRQVQGHLKVLKMRKRAEIERRRLEPFNWDKGKGAPMNEKKFKPVHEKRVRLPPQKFSPGTQQRRNVYGGDHSAGLRDLNMEDFNGIGSISDHSISSESASRGAADSSDSLSTAGADDSQSREMNEEEEEEEDHPLMQSAVTHAGTLHIMPSGTCLPLTKTASVHFEHGGGPSSSASLGVTMEGSIPFEDCIIYDNPRMKTCGHEARGLNGVHGIRGVDNLRSEVGEEEACKIMEVATMEDGRAMQQQEPDVVEGCSSPSLKEPVQLCSHLSETMQAAENTGMLRATAAVVDTNSSGVPLSSHPVIEVDSESDDISSLVGRLSQKVPPDITIMTTRGELGLGGPIMTTRGELGLGGPIMTTRGELGLGGPIMSTEVNAKGGSVSNSDVAETKFEKEEQHLCGSMTLKGNAAALLASVSLPCITLVSHAVMPSSVAGHTADLREKTGGQGSDVLPFSSIFEPEKDVDVIPDSQPESSESFIC